MMPPMVSSMVSSVMSMMVLKSENLIKILKSENLILLVHDVLRDDHDDRDDERKARPF